MTITSFPQSRSIEKPRFRARVNWPLLTGLLLVGSVIYLAIVGPNIAPHDPLQENLLIKDDRTGEWHIPPFPAFEVTGYPLGSDEFGRDLYSRLLWAIRPTLQMVAIVATVRLVLGTLFGLIAGWSTGRVGSFFDTLISGALALPGLLVALGTIAVVGVELGLIAFVIGLSVTGWAETARIVREQTRSIKSQVFIEAAHALGASDTQIVFQHVVRQIQAMLLMLLAFEIGSTLMLTAGLGFLGYYIGGDVWVDVSDFVARRTSGAPELGQMLATAWVRLTDPWGLVSVGSLVFTAVLGFNLIGEGLRLRLNQEVQGGILKWLGERLAGIFLSVEHYITYPAKKLLRRPVPFALLRLALGMVVGALAIWGWEQGWFKLPEAEVSFLYSGNATLTPLPTQGTGQAVTPTPDTQVISVDAEETPPPPLEPAVIWEFDTGSILTGAPVVVPGGTIYATTSDNLLHAFAPDGRVLWQYTLPARPVDSPALASDGTIYLSDAEGALNAVSPDGEAVWRYVMEIPRTATSGPTVASDGRIYYPLGSQTGMVQAVSSSGEGLWLAQGKTFSYYNRPQVSADGSFIFLWNDVFNAADGTLIEFEYPSKIDRFLAGNDGKTYFRTGHNLVEWQWVNGAPEIVQDISWSYPVSEETLPQEAAVTKNQISWELYTTEFGGSTSVFWIEVVEGEGQQLGATGVDVSLGTVVYMDDETLFTVLCGFGDYQFPNTSSPKPQCDGIQPLGEENGEEEFLWSVKLERTGNMVGADYEPETDMLYIATQEGVLYAVDITPTPVEETIQIGGASAAFELPTIPVAITDPVVAWEYRPEDELAGGPVAALDGTIYAATVGGKVLALQQDGTLIWETILDPAPGAGPELSPDGTLFVPDASGGLAALDVQGNILWHFVQSIPGLKPASKPVITANGIIAYSITDNYFGYVQTVSATGEGVWLSETATTARFDQPPRASAAGDMIFLAENVFDSSDGRLLNLSPPPDVPIEPDEFFTGLNGKNYILVKNTLFEWQRNDGQIEILTTIEWDFRSGGNSAFSSQTPVEVHVDPDGIIMVIYRSNVLWLTQEGETLALTATTENDTIARLFYATEARGAFLCGIHLSGSTDPASEHCTGLSMDQEKPVWRINFGSSNLVMENILGAARTPAGFVFASRKGVLYGVMEKSIAEAWEAARTQPEPLPLDTGVVDTGNGWRFDSPEPLLTSPIAAPDGTLYLLGESQTLYILTLDGSVRATIPLPTPVHAFHQSSFGGPLPDVPLPPFPLDDGGVLVISTNRVYALNLDGSLRWEFPLPRPPFSFPSQDQVRGPWYLIDDQGTLYQFSAAEGLIWEHDLAEGLKAASPAPVFGPNGEIYYTITNGTKGMIEALQHDGSPIQRIDLTTFSFFRPIEITPDGVWLVVDDNVVNTASSRLVEADNLEFHIEEFAMGYDGKKYLIAGSSVIEWEVGANGLQIVNQVAVAFPENRQAGIPPSFSVSKDSVYWIRLFAAFGSRWINLWVNPQGEVVGLVNIDTNQELILNVDEETNSLSVCHPNRDENQLECRGYENGIGFPAWEINIEGLGRVSDVFHQDGRLYVQVDEDTVQVVDVVLP